MIGLDTADAVGAPPDPGSSPDAGPSIAESRRAAVAVIAFAVTLPLQWQVLAATALGVVRWFHAGALVGAVLYLWRCPRWWGPVSGLRLLVVAVAGIATIALALSRAVLLALGLAVVLAVVSMLVQVMRPGRPAGGAGRWIAIAGVTITVVLLGPPVWRLLYSRMVGDTGSYQDRLDTLAVPPSEIADRALSGGDDLPVSTHMLIADSFLRAGWLGGLAALAIVAVVLRYGYASGRRYLRIASLQEFVAFTASMLITIRAFTTGNGYLHQTEWAAFGVLVAVTHGSWHTTTAPPATGAA